MCADYGTHLSIIRPLLRLIQSRALVSGSCPFARPLTAQRSKKDMSIPPIPKRSGSRLSQGLGGRGPQHDVPAIVAHHEPDMVMFDLPPPLQCKGIKAYEQTWDLLFPLSQPRNGLDFPRARRDCGPGRRLRRLRSCAAGPTRPAIQPTGRYPVRLTLGLRKVDSDWRIAHEHHPYRHQLAYGGRRLSAPAAIACAQSSDRSIVPNRRRTAGTGVTVPNTP